MAEQTLEGLEGLTINDLLLVLEQLPLNILEDSRIVVPPTSSSAQDCCQLPDTPSSHASSNRQPDGSISSCDCEQRAAQKLGSKGGGVAMAAQGRSDVGPNIFAVNQGMNGLEAFLNAVQMRGSMVSDPSTAKLYEQLSQSADSVSSMRSEENVTRECPPLSVPPALSTPAIDYNQGFVAISLGPSRPTLVLSLQPPTGLCTSLPQHQPPPDPPPQPGLPPLRETQDNLSQTSLSESADLRVSSCNASGAERQQENLASNQHPPAEQQQENLASNQHPSSLPISSEVELPLPDFGTIGVRGRHRRSASFSSIPYSSLSVLSPTALPSRHMDWESASLEAKRAGDAKVEVELPVEVQEQCEAEHAKNSLKFDASMSRRTRHKKEDLVSCGVKLSLKDNAVAFGGGEKEDGGREEDMAQILERKKKELLETKPTLSWRFPKVEEYLKKEGGKEAGCPEPRGAKIQELLESLKAMPRLATIDPSPRQEPSPSKVLPPLEKCSPLAPPSDSVATQEANLSESASLSSSSPSPPSSPSSPLPNPSPLPASRIRQKPATHCEVPQKNRGTRPNDAGNGSQPGPKRFDPAVLPLDLRDVAAGEPGRNLPVPVVSRTEATMQGSANVEEVEWAPTELQMAAMADMGSSRRSRAGGVSAIGESFSRLLSQRNISPLRRRKAKPETGREQARAKSWNFNSSALPRIDECGEGVDSISLGVNKRLPGAGLGSTSKPVMCTNSAKEVLKSSVLNALVRDLHDVAARETSADTSSLGPPKAMMQRLPSTLVPPVEKGAVPALHGEVQVPRCLSPPNVKEVSSGPPPGPQRDERCDVRDATPMPRRQVIRAEIEEEVSGGRRQKRVGSTFLPSWGSKKNEQHGSGGSIKVSWSESPDRHMLVEPSEKERSGFGFHAALRGLKNRMMGSGSSRTEHRGQQNFMRGSWPSRQSSSEQKFRGAPPVPLESGSENSSVGGGGHQLKGSAYGHSWQGKGSARHKASAGANSFGNSTRDLKKPAKLNSPWEEALWKAWEDDQKGGEKGKKTVQEKETWEKALRSAWEEELSSMKPQTVSARSSSRSFSLSGRRQSSRIIRHGRSPGRDSSEGSVVDPWESLSDSVVPNLVTKHPEDDFPNVQAFHSIPRKKSFLSVLWGRNQFDKEAMSH